MKDTEESSSILLTQGGWTDMAKFRIMDRIETLEYILENKVSIARFGDGELMQMWFGREGFQKHDKNLKKQLIEVVNAKDEGFLVCLPHQLVTLDGLKPDSRKWYREQLLWTKPLWKYYVKDKRKIYGDAFISRPWMSFLDVEKAVKSFELLKKLWENKDVVIIEGDKTRLGCNNDLLDCAQTVKRIICPSHNAFSVIDRIFDEAVRQDKSVIFVLALGPTASILSYRLFKAGFMSYDLGHMDIEYEWFKLRSDGKVAIPGKYVNEAGGNNTFREVGELGDYESQIIARVGL